jgi:hypothetical protein
MDTEIIKYICISNVNGPQIMTVYICPENIDLTSICTHLMI